MHPGRHGKAFRQIVHFLIGIGHFADLLHAVADDAAEILVKIPPDDEDNPDKEKKLTTSETRTGDSTSPILWIVLMGVALAGIILTIVSWRRDRKDGEEA